MRKPIIAGIVFLLAVGAGYMLFISGPREELSGLQKKVDRLSNLQEKPAPSEPKVDPPSASQLRQALQGAISSSGIEVDNINRISERTEISSESSPAVVARFAEDVSKGPLIATAISGDAWPVSVVIIVPKYTLSR